MAMNNTYATNEPPRAEIDALQGAIVLEFGTAWCGYCRGAQGLIANAFRDYPQVQHLKIEDGPGRRLGRSYRVKLWPTLIFLRDGQEVARVVRPDDTAAVESGLRQIA